MAKITYQDKAFLNENSQISIVNKVQDTDLNEIKNVVNENDEAFTQLLENFNSLFKFQNVNQQVTIGANGNVGSPIANINTPDGYTILGILPLENGYADQWQVTYAVYQNQVFAYIKSYYAQQLTAFLKCTVIYIKSDYLS